MFAQLLDFLNQPYPDHDDPKSIIRGSFFGGLIVFFVLYAFQPFGIHTAGPDVFWMCMVFGGITVLVAMGFDFLLVYGFRIRRDQPSWTLWKWLIMIVVLILLISAANYLFLAFLMHRTFEWNLFVGVLLRTALVGVIPAGFLGTINIMRSREKFENLALELTPYPPTPSPQKNFRYLPLQQSEKTFAINPDHILFLEARQNYVYLVHEAEGEIKTELLRNTLKAMENALGDTHILRSHRSYLVNPNRIQHITGNAQGLIVSLDEKDKWTVPVSRTYIPVFRDLNT